MSAAPGAPPAALRSTETIPRPALGVPTLHFQVRGHDKEVNGAAIFSQICEMECAADRLAARDLLPHIHRVTETMTHLHPVDARTGGYTAEYTSKFILPSYEERRAEVVITMTPALDEVPPRVSGYVRPIT